MTTAMVQASGLEAAQLEQILVEGNLEKLTAQERLDYYAATCQSLGLNPLTKPFAYIKLNGKLSLYPLRDATDQIRKIHHISVRISSREMLDESYVVTAVASMPDGRTDESTGVVSLAGLRGEAKSNAMMKTETKAKRRVTLSIAGLGWVDESEVDSISQAQIGVVSIETGEILTGADEPMVRSVPAQPPEDLGTCPRHPGTPWLKNRLGTLYHKHGQDNELWCNPKAERRQDSKDALESAHEATAETSQESMTLSDLEGEVQQAGMSWKDFESKVLQATWADFIGRQGASPSVALARLNTYLDLYEEVEENNDV